MADVNTKVEVKGLQRTRRILNGLPERVFSDSNMNRLGSFFAAKIKARTAEGKDVDGNFFKPYSPKYANFRKLNGRQEDPVNLFWTGSMMNAMTYKLGKAFDGTHTITLFFRDTEDKYGGNNPLKAAGLNQDRRFFDVSDDELAQAADILRSKV